MTCAFSKGTSFFFLLILLSAHLEAIYIFLMKHLNILHSVCTKSYKNKRLFVFFLFFTRKTVLKHTFTLSKSPAIKQPHQPNR